MSFDTYISEFTEQDALSNEQAVSLHRLYRNGEQGAYDALVRGTMRLVVKIANDYKRYGMDFEDVVSNGTIGLMKAIENYNAEKGAFSQYASAYINKYIRMGFDKCRGIHTKRYDRMTEEERSSCIVESLNEKVGNGDTEFADGLEADCPTPSEKVAMDASVDAMLQAIETVLDAKEQFIVRSHSGLGDTEPMTLEQIASHLNCTRERVRQMEQVAFRKIREYVER